MMMCVNNEERFLQANLVYHHALGVRRAYVFLDRCTDRSEQIVNSFPWARAIKEDRADAKYSRIFQNRCAEKALNLAREDGFEWLMHLDPDEFAFGNNPDPRKEAAQSGDEAQPFDQEQDHWLRVRGDLVRMLQRLPEGTELVEMRTKEAVPLILNDKEGFWENVYFQDREPLKRKLLDPCSGKIIEHKKLLGHHRGKAIVNTAANVRSRDSHGWVPDVPELKEDIRKPNSLLKTEYRGFHYHYLLVSTQQWLEKYRRFKGLAEVWPSAIPVEFPKMSWRQASLEMSPEEADAYLNEWVFLSRDKLEEIHSQKLINKEDYVKRILDEVCNFEGVPHA